MNCSDRSYASIKFLMGLFIQIGTMRDLGLTLKGAPPHAAWVSPGIPFYNQRIKIEYIYKEYCPELCLNILLAKIWGLLPFLLKSCFPSLFLFNGHS